MRRCRLKLLHQSACYHVVCRITQGQLWLGAEEKVSLCELLHRVAAYCGVTVLTFCVMSNHFHLLIRVPHKAVADAALNGVQLGNRVALLYGTEAGDLVRELWEGRGSPELDRLWEGELAMHLGRMHDLSVFMQLLKQRFTMGHNRNHGTRGTLWTERFKSVLVESREGERNPLQIVAAYIDLNPVRAGVVAEPEDYPYSGYGSANLGKVESQHGIMELSALPGWSGVKSWYAGLCGGKLSPSESPESGPGSEPVTLGSVLRSRQAALVKGAVLGSAKFVMEVLQALVEIRRSVRPQAYASGGLGGDLWVGQRYRSG